MLCRVHQDCTETVADRCRECLFEETKTAISEMAYGKRALQLNTGEPPLLFVPLLQLGPSDFPWLTDPDASSERVKILRNALALTYTLASSAAANQGDHLGAGLLIGPAVAFEPDDHVAWWEIHYNVATTVKDTLLTRGDLNAPKLRNKTLKMLTTVAYHTILALEHWRKVQDSRRENPPKEELKYASDLLQALKSENYCLVDPTLLAEDTSGTYAEYLFPGVPRGPHF